jgi:hypothetical protein
MFESVRADSLISKLHTSIMGDFNAQISRSSCTVPDSD